MVDEDQPGAADGLNLPETLIMETPRGRHYVFRQAQLDQRNTQSDPAPAVDIRGNGGMFVWHGHAIHDANIAPWPFPHPISGKTGKPLNEDIKIDSGSQFKGVDEYRQVIIAVGTDGQKNDAALKIASSLAAQGVSEKFTTRLIQAICPVRNANLQNSVTSAYQKYRRGSFRHNELELVRDDKDRPIWKVANAETLLIQHIDLEGVLASNAFTGRRAILRQLPRTIDGNRDLDDDDYTAATGWINRNGFPAAREAIPMPAMPRACRANTFDP